MSAQPNQAKTAARPKMNSSSARQPPSKSKPKDQVQTIPERDIKQNSGVNASLSLQAAKQAWELRQAMHGAADAKAREDLLAKAINKEIEAESFGKAAKYTQSGAFQGLAAGAGLGVKPGVTLGKLTGALVGGVVATVTGLLGGGIGSVYGAMNGPMWDLGQMASHGVHGMAKDLLGDWMPDFAATSSQKKALEKMVLQTKNTPTPSKEELEQIKAGAPDDMPQSWSKSTREMTSYIPSMPSMPSRSSLPAMPSMGGLTSAFGLGSGKANVQENKQAQVAPTEAPATPQAQAQASAQHDRSASSALAQGDQPASSATTSSQEKPTRQIHKANSTQKSARSIVNPKANEAQSRRPAQTSSPSSNPTTSQKDSNTRMSSSQSKSRPNEEINETKEDQAGRQARRTPRKLATKSNNGEVNAKKAPRKLQVRQAST